MSEIKMLILSIKKCCCFNPSKNDDSVDHAMPKAF